MLTMFWMFYSYMYRQEERKRGEAMTGEKKEFCDRSRFPEMNVADSSWSFMCQLKYLALRQSSGFLSNVPRKVQYASQGAIKGKKHECAISRSTHLMFPRRCTEYNLKSKDLHLVSIHY